MEYDWQLRKSSTHDVDNFLTFQNNFPQFLEIPNFHWEYQNITRLNKQVIEKSE